MLPFVSERIHAAVVASVIKKRSVGTLFVFTRDYVFTPISFGLAKDRGLDWCLDKHSILKLCVDVVFPDTEYEFVFTNHAQNDLSQVFFLPCKFPPLNDKRLLTPLEDFVGLDCAGLIEQYVEDPRLAPAMLLCPFERALDAFLKANRCDNRFLVDLLFVRGQDMGCWCSLRAKLFGDDNLLALCLARLDCLAHPYIELGRRVTDSSEKLLRLQQPKSLGVKLPFTEAILSLANELDLPILHPPILRDRKDTASKMQAVLFLYGNVFAKVSPALDDQQQALIRDRLAKASTLCPFKRSRQWLVFSSSSPSTPSTTSTTSSPSSTSSAPSYPSSSPPPSSTTSSPFSPSSPFVSASLVKETLQRWSFDAVYYLFVTVCFVFILVNFFTYVLILAAYLAFNVAIVLLAFWWFCSCMCRKPK